MIVYLHGFRSSPESWKAKELRAWLAARGQTHLFACPALSPVPFEAVAEAEAVIAAATTPVTLVGSSLGGFYATHLAEKLDLRAVLINPGVLGSIDPRAFIGEHDFFYGGGRFSFTAGHAEQLLALDPPRLTPERYLLLVETGDEVLDHRAAIRRYAGCRQIVLAGGNHGFSRFVDYLPQLAEFAGL